jgi:enterobactin synthetase component D
MENQYDILDRVYPLLDSYDYGMACSFSVAQIDSVTFDQFGIFYPDEIQRSVDKRKCEFLAGRICAAKALSQIDQKWEKPLQIRRGDHGVPLWPVGIQGSITHNTHCAAAVVTNKPGCYIGIDTEDIIQKKEDLDSLLSLAMNPKEFKNLIEKSAFQEFELATLIFSAKQAVYKCLFPIVKRFFDFSVVSIVKLDADKKEFLMEFNEDLCNDVKKGAVIKGRFIFENQLLHVKVVYQKQV